MGKKRSSTADVSPSTPDNVRLHITPLTAETASSILPAGTNLSSISYHTLPTFPDAPFAFVNLPVEAADKLKKKLKNAMFRGVKVRVEDARPETWKELVGETAEERRERKRVKREKKEKKQGLLEGVQLPDERRVARGWVEGTDKELKKDKRGECLFKAAIPANKTDLIKEKPKKEKTKEERAAEKAKEKEEKKEKKETKKQRKDEKKRIVKEFENLQKFPSFLKTSQLDPTRGPEDLVGEYNEEVGWTDRKGTVLEEPAKKKSKKEKKEKEETKVEVKETIPQPVNLPEIKKTKKGEAVVVFDDDEMVVNKAEENFNDIPENKGWAVQSSKAKQVYHSDTESEDEAVAEEQAEAEEKQKVAEDPEEEEEEEAENDKEEEDESEKEEDEQEEEEEEEEEKEEEEEEEEEEAAEDAMDVDVSTPKQPTELEAKVELEVVAEDKDESEDEIEAESEASDSESESDDDEEETADPPKTKKSPITKAPSPPAVAAPVEVHPLEALYKPTALTISTDVASESAGGFKFGFGGGNDSDDDDEATTSTPYKDPSRYRSSAPTPDTAIGNKRFFSPTASTGSSEDEEPATTPRAPFSHPPGIDAPLLFLHEDSRFLKGLSVWNQLPTPKALQPKEDEDIVDPAELWKKRFYEQRGEWNREWKRRRREGMKAKRKREARNGPGASGANRV
jgi:hypothetical protein